MRLYDGSDFSLRFSGFFQTIHHFLFTNFHICQKTQTQTFITAHYAYLVPYSLLDFLVPVFIMDSLLQAHMSMMKIYGMSLSLKGRVTMYMLKHTLLASAHWGLNK